MVATVLLMTGTSLITLSVVPYIKDIVRGKTKPRAVSYAIWAVLMGLTTIVAWQENQLYSAVLSATSTIGCIVILLLTIRHTSLDLTQLERATLLGALLGVGMWLVFDDPMLVLVTTLTVDAIAYLPTFANGWRNPHHESMSMFVITIVGSSFVLLAAVMAHASSHGLIYPIYSVVFACIMTGILLTRRIQHLKT